MSTHLKTIEIVNAAITALDGASLSFSPKVIQEGSLLHYVRNPDVSFDVPALFVAPAAVDIQTGGEGYSDIGGLQIYTETVLRICLVASWDDAAEVVDTKVANLQEIVEVFIGSGNTPFDIAGSSIAGYTLQTAIPMNMEFEPPEDGLVSQNQELRLTATACMVQVTGFAERT